MATITREILWTSPNTRFAIEMDRAGWILRTVGLMTRRCLLLRSWKVGMALPAVSSLLLARHTEEEELERDFVRLLKRLVVPRVFVELVTSFRSSSLFY